ncbi:dynactin-associated protein [Lemur catta]|uniref:dynactin-associated protein n=1 Tax=Lemur catta TaxID=9447 RepID=UPI001E266BE5|nr:dynactin-associated protein [Lemur catta]
MDKKQGKYVLNVEHSENQPPVTCPSDQEAHSSTRWCPPSMDTTCDVSSDLTGVWVSPGILQHSRCPQPEVCNTQLKGNCRNDWSLWKVFLACLLACVITTAIGVLIICLVNNKGNDNVSVVIQLPRNNGEPTVTSPGTTSTTSQTTETTSTEPTTTTTSTDTTTATTSTQSTTSVTTTVTSAEPTTSTPSTEPTTTTTSTDTTTATTSTQSPTSAATTVTSAETTTPTPSTQLATTTAVPTTSSGTTDASTSTDSTTATTLITSRAIPNSP